MDPTKTLDQRKYRTTDSLSHPPTDLVNDIDYMMTQIGAEVYTKRLEAGIKRTPEQIARYNQGLLRAIKRS
jgi:hypothetical protein